MNKFNKLITTLLSGAILISSIVGATANAEEITYDMVTSSLSDVTVLDSDITLVPAENYAIDTSAPDLVVTNAVDSGEIVVTTTTTASNQLLIPAVTSAVIPDNKPVTTTDAFNVFDIYDAHLAKVSSVTTTKTTTTTTTTTTTAKATTTTIAPTNVGSGIKGIDVSKWQGDIDWAKVKADGIKFAIIRAGYGKYASQEDPKFDQNMKAAKAAGLKVGVYWYSYAVTVDEAYQEAEACYSVIKQYDFEYPLVFDIEERSQEALSVATVSAIIDAFCSTMQNKGYYVSLYSYSSFLNTKVYTSVLNKYDIWVAHYGVSSPNFSGAYGMWQYSSTGSVNGISGSVDLNYAYKDYPYLISSNGKNGY